MSESTRALLLAATTMFRQGQRAQAIGMFRQALAHDPGYSEGWYELGYLLKAQGAYQEALDAYGEALARGIQRPEEVHLNRAVIFADYTRRDDDAQRELEAALAIAPGYLPARLNLGNLHEERGDRDAAIACYDAILAAANDSVDDPHRDLRFEALSRVVKLRRPATLADPLLGELRDASSAQVSPGTRVNLLFALGETCDRIGAIEPAFDAFAKANRWLLRIHGRRYDPAVAARATATMIETFASADTGPHEPGAGAEPLFICGMYRSGSTLIEQVLGSHPLVTPGGEVPHLRQLAHGRLAPFPASMATRDPGRDTALAADYREQLQALFPQSAGGRYITDKRPDNYLLIGLIKRLLPAAKIVHTVRNPLDNGLSVFMQHLNPLVAGYSCDLADIGHHYGQYRRLMAHWKSLYPDSIFEFDYDAFVREPQPALERLLAFLGLPWDDRCLAFHRLGNTVKTASYWQVRQPLHANASGRWRQYGSHLDPMRQALIDAGVAFDDSR